MKSTIRRHLDSQLIKPPLWDEPAVLVQVLVGTSRSVVRLSSTELHVLGSGEAIRRALKVKVLRCLDVALQGIPGANIQKLDAELARIRGGKRKKKKSGRSRATGT